MTNSSKKWFACGAIHTRDDGYSFFNPMIPRWDEKIILEPGYNFIGGVSVTSIKKEVKTRFDSNTKMLLDVDFYYHTMLEYGMPIFYEDILIGNRVRDNKTLSNFSPCSNAAFSMDSSLPPAVAICGFPPPPPPMIFPTSCTILLAFIFAV